MNKVVMALGIIAGLLLFGQLDQAEAKGFYGSDLGQTYAVFTMIALAIAGFGILLALYTRETMSVKGH
ncbi:MAG TPA: hypothetical protein VLA68_04005 [Nitrososphaera sp.]|nr:hypothetical protein [Nitrososphaera sp.]